jgi:hypothetical protein
MTLVKILDRNLEEVLFNDDFNPIKLALGYIDDIEN